MICKHFKSSFLETWILLYMNMTINEREKSMFQFNKSWPY